jgi:hypothetical protein
MSHVPVHDLAPGIHPNAKTFGGLLPWVSGKSQKTKFDLEILDRRLLTLKIPTNF